ncbi:MAG: hypothetical protein RLZ83_15 [Pseudomonadota bacterium]|jgi:uncharacterized protein YunC (DUF1805 family)
MGAQTPLLSLPQGRVMAMDSAYDVVADNAGRDVVVNASYCGVLPARFIAQHRPRGAIGVDCGVGPAGASIAGLWFLEALDIPAAVADVMTVHLGDGVHLGTHGRISHLNQPAHDCGVRPGMDVMDAARRMLEAPAAAARAAADVTNRQVMHTDHEGRQVVCVDSIAFGLPQDRDNVLLTAGHTGRSAVPYLLKVRPHGFICSDGGRGLDSAGTAGLHIVDAHGLAGATVDARRARMGDGLSTYREGIVSDLNSLAHAAGVRVGMSAADAALRLLRRTAPR